jgi:large subunit ribosomal protein L21
MYAIVEIAGQQFKVTNGQQIFVNRLHDEEGSKVSFEKVLLIDNEGAVKVGTPTIEGACVEATIKEHLKGKKVIVFKKKRRKGYQTTNGSRQYLSKIVIDNIIM